MKILIVGAGAVGQVYAFHLQKAGHEVHFYVKEKYAEEMRGEQILYPLNRQGARNEPTRFRAHGVVTSPAQVSSTRWDQIYLCMSSTGLRGPWLETFAPATGDATIICLQPGQHDYDYLAGLIPRERIVCGMISLISYHAPLPGETVPEPGMAYWFPPLSPTPFSGPKARAEAVVTALNRGGHPAKITKDAVGLAAFPGAVLMALISALELADWSFDKVSDPARLQGVCRAVKDLGELLNKRGAPSAWAAIFITPLTIKLLMKLAPIVLPLPVETYLQVHFTKVGDQTRLFMQTSCEEARKLGLSLPHLEALTQTLVKHTLT